MDRSRRATPPESSPQRAVVLLSGGLDSGVALGLWLRAGHEVAVCLTADYGQRAAAPEARAARGLAERLGVPWAALDLSFLGAAAERAGSALHADAERHGRTLPEGTVDSPGDAASAAAVWVPARNVVLIAAAAAEAESRGATAVIVGFNREEAATFPDNSVEFLERASRVMELGTRTGVTVLSPTADLDKPGLGEAATTLGLSADDFWSCYGGGEAACGRCESCARFARAFAGCRGSGAGEESRRRDGKA